jgi:hypothetical protein
VRADQPASEVKPTTPQLSFQFPRAGEWLKALSDVQALYAGVPFSFPARHEREYDDVSQALADSGNPSAVFRAQCELVELFWRTWFETASKAYVSVWEAVGGFPGRN